MTLSEAANAEDGNKEATEAIETPSEPLEKSEGADTTESQAEAAAEGDEVKPEDAGEDVVAAEGESGPAEATADEPIGEASTVATLAKSFSNQLVKVLVPQVVNKLHVSMGAVPDHLATSRSFYFIRSRPGKLEYADLDTALDLGVLGEGPSLKMLEQTLSHVFLPMLVQMTGSGGAASELGGGALDGSSGQGSAQISSVVGNKHRDLLSNMQKFVSQVSQALQQLNGDVTLPVSHCPKMKISHVFRYLSDAFDLQLLVVTTCAIFAHIPYILYYLVA